MVVVAVVVVIVVLSAVEEEDRWRRWWWRGLGGTVDVPDDDERSKVREAREEPVTEQGRPRGRAA